MIFICKSAWRNGTHWAKVSQDVTTRDDSSLSENGQSPDGHRFKSCRAQLISGSSVQPQERQWNDVKSLLKAHAGCDSGSLGAASQLPVQQQETK